MRQVHQSCLGRWTEIRYIRNTRDFFAVTLARGTLISIVMMYFSCYLDKPYSLQLVVLGEAAVLFLCGQKVNSEIWNDRKNARVEFLKESWDAWQKLI